MFIKCKVALAPWGRKFQGEQRIIQIKYPPVHSHFLTHTHTHKAEEVLLVVEHFLMLESFVLATVRVALVIMFL